MPDLVRQEPIDVVASDEARIDLLQRFNGNWRHWTFRDVIPVEDRYSDLQKEYFATEPKDRQKLIDKMKMTHNNNCDNTR